MEQITSRDNSKIKQVRLLSQRKHRQASGLFVVEGIHHVGEAAAARGGAALATIFYAPDLLSSEFGRQLVQEQSARGVPCFATSKEVFTSIASKDNPQGILALARMPQSSLDELHPGNFSWGVALAAPQDPGNVGAVLRTIDSVGADGLLLLDESVDPYHPTAVRASMGALFWHPVVCTSFEKFAAWAGRHGYAIYGTSAHAEQDYRAIDAYRRPAILLMGSERQGLSPDQQALCTTMVRLPMAGRVSSLNLAVATGVLLYAMGEKRSR